MFYPLDRARLALDFSTAMEAMAANKSAEWVRWSIKTHRPAD
jgi:hypothetical protein